MARGRLMSLIGPAILLAAALLPDLRPLAIIALLAGWCILRVIGRDDAIAWAATLPLATTLVWPWLLGGDAPLGEVACADPLSEIAIRRLAVALAGLAITAALADAHGSGLAELGLRRPTRLEAALALGGFVVLVVGGLVIGPWIARPFFGQLSFAMPAAAIVPALVFGIANGVLEEVVYRGVLQAWLARLFPIGAAIVFQGLVFGIVHAGPEVLALLPVHIALLGSVGIAGGLVRWRTGSLWVPIGVHIGADVALYFGLACRPVAG
jgi:membrane protease YdiL (CAAX protease family)